MNLGVDLVGADILGTHSVEEAVELIHEINLGATAIGTGLNAPGGYAESVRRHLAETIAHLRAACLTLAERCVDGITANTDMLRTTVENSIGLVTALNPHIGYTAATDIAQEALATGRGIAELVVEQGLLPAHLLAALLTPERVAGTAS